MANRQDAEVWGLAVNCANTSAQPEQPERPAVLVVSAIEEDRASLRSILEPSGWRLHEASRIIEAMRILSEERVPVMLCERELPVGDWKALLDALQLLPRQPHFIVTSRQADNHLWSDVLASGGFDVLAVPFDAAEVLRVALTAWLRWTQRRDAAAVAEPRVA